jgi:2-amino-4-hydroxy-6-hydroxymethyldihydropteridine diphosphokinase
MARVGIALGSNLGDRLATLREALRRLLLLPEISGPVLEAPVFETDPVDCPPDSPAFLNSVVELSCSCRDPLHLLAQTRAIERAMGRNHQAPRNAPRVIDLDLLYFADTVLDHPDLTLPHPRLHLRRFVLAPLAAIRPDWRPAPGAADAAALLAALPQDDPAPPRLFTGRITAGAAPPPQA